MTTKEEKRMEQLGRFTNKRIPSFERIERLRAYAITFTDQGDLEAARDLNLQVEYWETTRRMTGKPAEPKLGGMDRVGVAVKSEPLHDDKEDRLVDCIDEECDDYATEYFTNEQPLCTMHADEARRQT